MVVRLTGLAAPRNERLLTFVSPADFEAWLESNAAEAGPIWLALGKGAHAPETLTYEHAVESALCFGWIDGQKARGDDVRWLQRFSRRGPRSPWSRINRDRAERLISEGRMRPAGLAEVERAQADGRWDEAYEGQRTARIPDDLQRQLDADPALAKQFASLDGAGRYSIIWRLNEAKRPETRERRMTKFIEMLRRGERP